MYERLLQLCTLRGGERTMREEMAIMKGVSVGMRDTGHPCMWFSVNQEGSGSLQVLSWKEAEELIRKADVYDIKELNGKACIVEVDGNFMRFKRMAEI